MMRSFNLNKTADIFVSTSSLQSIAVAISSFKYHVFSNETKIIKNEYSFTQNTDKINPALK